MHKQPPWSPKLCAKKQLVITTCFFFINKDIAFLNFFIVIYKLKILTNYAIQGQGPDIEKATDANIGQND